MPNSEHQGLCPGCATRRRRISDLEQILELERGALRKANEKAAAARAACGLPDPAEACRTILKILEVGK